MGECTLSGQFIMYVKTHCPFCLKAEKLLAERNIDRKIIPFDESLDLLEHMKWAYSHSTVPMIFHKDGQDMKFIGGYTDLASYLQEQNGQEAPNTN